MQKTRNWIRITAVIQVPIVILGQLASCRLSGDDSLSTSEQLVDVSQDAGAVQPLEGCVAHIPDGNAYAVFPYRNDLQQIVIVAPEHNRLEPNLEQPPTAFAPGLGAFAVALPAQQGLAWQFAGREVSVTFAAPACELLADWQTGGWQIAIDGELIHIRIPEEPPGINLPPAIIDTEQIPSNGQVPRTVGNTPGELTVTDDGAARYTIPIRVPAGRKDIAPDLAFSYSSRGGNGLLGVGWNLRGLSVIQRCKKTRGTHNEVSNVRYELDGAYCLDGEPLVRVGTAQLQNGSREYRTERDRFARIVMNSSDSEGPTSWTVYTKEGQIHRYGIRGGSIVGGWQVVPNVKLPGTTIDVDHPQRVRFAWALAEVSDRTGNTMTFDYDLEDPCASGPSPGADCGVEHRPREIRWTYGNAHPYANRAVRFHYEDRPDIENQYVTGLQIYARKRLAAVEVIGPKGAGEATVRTYRSSYQTAAVSGRSLLRSIEECDPMGVCKAPTEFEWDMGDPEFEKVAVSLPDVAYFLNFYETTKVNPDSGSSMLKNTPVPQGQWWALLVVDVNGDGRDDILYRRPSRHLFSDEWMKVDRWGQQLDGEDVEFEWVFRLAGEGGAAFGPPHASGLPFQGAWGFGEMKEIPRPMDIDGDGRTDLAVPGEYRDVGSPVWKYRPWTWFRSTGSGFVPVAATGETALTGIDPIDMTIAFFMRTPHMVVADIDGDRVPDPVRNNFHHFNASGFPVTAWSVGRNGPGGPSFYQNLIAPGSYFNSPMRHESSVYVADVDGSGRRAFVFPSLETSVLSGAVTDERWYRAALASRTGAVAELPMVDLPRATKEPFGLRYLFLDVNGDGISDALEMQNTSILGMPIWPKVAMNTGTVGHSFGPSGFLPAVPAMVSTLDLLSPFGIPEFKDGVDAGLRVFDYNQDGKTDLFNLGHVRPLIYQSTPAGMTIAKRLEYPGLGAMPEEIAATGQVLSQLLDFDGDGLTDFTSLSVGTASVVFPPGDDAHIPVSTFKPDSYSLDLYRRKGNRADMITVIHDGLARRTTGSHRIEYRPHTARASVATSFPIAPVTRGMWVVDKVWSDTATEGPTDDGYGQTIYTYTDGLSDMVGRGWLGFRRTSSMHMPTGTVTTKEFTRNHIRFGTHYPFVGQPTTVTTQVTPSGMPTVVRRSTFDYSIISGNPFMLGRPYAMAEIARADVERQGIDRRDTWIETQYDGFGNVTRRIRRNFGLTPAFDDEVFAVTNRTDIWLLGMVTDSIVTSSIAGDTARRHIRRTFDIATGELLLEQREPGDPALRQDKTIVRNIEGLPRAENVGSVPRWISYSYDADGIAVVKTTNALGHVTSVINDRGLGVPTKTVDENGIATRYQYDRFGRLRATIPTAGPMIEAHYSQATSPLTIVESSATGAQWKTDHDRLGRVTRESTLMLDGTSWSVVEQQYDKRFPDRPSAVSRPYATAAERVFTRFSYDELGRSTRVTHPDGSIAQSTYSLTRHTSTDEKGRRRTMHIDDLGLVSRASDRMDDGTETPIRIAHGAFRLPRKIFDAHGNMLELRYDAIGRLIEQRDPDRGVERFEYDDLDQVARLVAPEATTSFGRDLIGRAITRNDKDGTATFTWDSSPSGIGKLASAWSSDGVLVDYDYDYLSRPSQTRYTIGVDTYAVDTSYDGFGRVEHVTYPAVGTAPRLQVRRTYAANGEWVSTGDPTSALTYWRAEERNGAGDLTSEAFGNGLRTRRHFDPQRGFLERIDTGTGIAPADTGSIQAVRYTHDVDANLKTRIDLRTAGGPQTEAFTYDALDRLIRWAIAGKGNVAFSYDELGNLTMRRTVTSTSIDLQTFQYNGIDASGRAVGPHALTSASYGGFSYDAAGQQITAPGRTVDFTAIGRPRRIIEDGDATEFVYDAFQDRAEKRSSEGRTVYVGGLYEKRTTPAGTEHVFLVAGAERVVAQVTWLVSAIGTTQRTSYIHDERQGSITTITDATGAITERLRFDPYGRRVNPDSPLAAGSAPASGIRLGYTSHEHEDELGLVNMQGRMYDPRAMRFITPDLVVVDPLRTQAYNRYAYVMNNPTRYTDPSGYVPASTTPTSPDTGKGLCKNEIKYENGNVAWEKWECAAPVFDDNGQRDNGSRTPYGDFPEEAPSKKGDVRHRQGPNGIVEYVQRGGQLGWQPNPEPTVAPIEAKRLEQGHAIGPENDPFRDSRSLEYPTDKDAAYHQQYIDDYNHFMPKLAAMAGAATAPRPPPRMYAYTAKTRAYMNKTHYLYILVRKQNIVKIGTTVNTFERYPMWVGKLFNMFDVEMIVLTDGKYRDIRATEKNLIKAYKDAFGRRPFWNYADH